MTPDVIGAWVAAAATLVTAATGAYVRWNRKAQRALRLERRARQLYREALDKAIEIYASNRRVALANNVPPADLKKMPKFVLNLIEGDLQDDGDQNAA